MARHFASLSDIVLDEFIQDKDAKNTKSVIRSATKSMSDYLTEKCGNIKSLMAWRDVLFSNVCLNFVLSYIFKFFGIIKHLLTGYSGNSKFIVPSEPTIALGDASGQ